MTACGDKPEFRYLLTESGGKIELGDGKNLIRNGKIIHTWKARVKRRSQSRDKLSTARKRGEDSLGKW